MEWRPITTAPINTQVLATWDWTWNEYGPHIEVCECGKDGKWFYSYGGDMPNSSPTHWMPQLKPPERSAE